MLLPYVKLNEARPKIKKKVWKKDPKRRGIHLLNLIFKKQQDQRNLWSQGWCKNFKVYFAGPSILIIYDPFRSVLIIYDPFLSSFLSILVYFDPFWSILIHFDPLWSIMIHFDLFWSNSIHLWSNDPIFKTFIPKQP